MHLVTFEPVTHFVYKIDEYWLTILLHIMFDIGYYSKLCLNLL